MAKKLIWGQLSKSARISRRSTSVFEKSKSSIKSWDESIFKVSEEVAENLRNGCPVVALESTIISHGMPFPQNLETASRVERTIRDHGAVPATIAVLDGRVCVGIIGSEMV